jgi:hypothetical protein
MDQHHSVITLIYKLEKPGIGSTATNESILALISKQTESFNSPRGKGRCSFPSIAWLGYFSMAWLAWRSLLITVSTQTLIKINITARYITTLLQNDTYTYIENITDMLNYIYTFTQLLSHTIGLKGPAAPTFFCRAHVRPVLDHGRPSISDSIRSIKMYSWAQCTMQEGLVCSRDVLWVAQEE